MDEIIPALKVKDPRDDVLCPHQGRRFLSFAPPHKKVEDERIDVEEMRCIDEAPAVRIQLPGFEIRQ